MRPKDAKPRQPADRRDRSRRKPPRPASGQPSTVGAIADPVYGALPLVEVVRTNAAGDAVTVREIDPDFRPRPPAGAVLGDIEAQSFCPFHHVPRYYYLDQERACVQCGQRFTFRAAEQKFWYETLKFHFDSVPIRCPTCRRSRRSDQACRMEVQEARAAVARDPRDPALQLALARGLIRHRQRFGSGDLDEAIHAAREVRRLSEPTPWPGSIEADYWEAAAHSAAGRTATARKLFTAFLAHRPLGRRMASLASDAEAWLQANPTREG